MLRFTVILDMFSNTDLQLLIPSLIYCFLIFFIIMIQRVLDYLKKKILKFYQWEMCKMRIVFLFFS